MNQNRNITISNTHGLTTRTTTGRPKKRATKEKPAVNFGPDLNLRGPQGPGAEAHALMKHHRDEAQAAFSNAIAAGASRAEALRMTRNRILAGVRAQNQYRAELAI